MVSGSESVWRQSEREVEKGDKSRWWFFTFEFSILPGLLWCDTCRLQRRQGPLGCAIEGESRSTQHKMHQKQLISLLWGDTLACVLCEAVMNCHRIPTRAPATQEENKRRRDNRASCLWYWILHTTPAESLMNFLQFHANGYQDSFIPLALVCNYWLSQERWAGQSPVNSRKLVFWTFGKITSCAASICMHERKHSM